MAFLFRPLLKSNGDLIEKLSNSGIIRHKEIADVMLKVDRGDFITFNSYQDNAQPIGYNATISAPHMHAYALELLYNTLKPGNNVLDIGSGSGYLSACFAYLVGENGKVIGIEHIYEVTALSINNINKNHSHLLTTKNVEFITGDGRGGYLKYAPYDAIHCGAAATPQIAEILCKQLNIGGKLVIPVELNKQTQIYRVYTKDEKGKVTFKDIMDVMYVPLTDQKEQRETNQFVKTLMIS